MATDKLLLITDRRAALMRYDTAIILKRFFFIEQSLVVSIAGWIPETAPLLLKMAYARILWEDSLTAEAMRQRIFELRFPSRLMTKEGEQPLIEFADEARSAPSALAFFQGLVEVFLPALRRAYRQYLDLADVIGDGPSFRFMGLAYLEKEQQIKDLEQFRAQMAEDTAQAGPAEEAWPAALKERLDALGGFGLDPADGWQGSTGPLPGRRPFQVAQVPAREAGFHHVRFYWPDIIVPDYAYGEGMALQLRSAISHINEVWAIEACAAFTSAFADVLGWEFVLDGARWTYDEARHCRMGYERLMTWGFTKGEIPLGTYIYDAATYGKDPIYRLGMLYFFETENIHKKTERAQKFHDYQDRLSEHDMDFDWADENKHAHYGNIWLARLLEVHRGMQDPRIVRDKCKELIDQIIMTATDEERAEILQVAQEMTDKAERLASAALESTG